MKDSLLYLMHAPWGWIKQRPHFFAEKLSEKYKVHVYALENIRNRHKLNSKCDYKDMPISKFYLPSYLRPQVRNKRFFNILYTWLFMLQVRRISKYKYIWITNSMIYRYLEPHLSPDQILIYDCMDDDLEFPSIKKDRELRKIYENLEGKVVERANYIFFSAKYLQEKVWGRNKFNKHKSIVVNNAIEMNSINNTNEKIDSLPLEIRDKLNVIKSSKKSLVYIGTISEWMDFDLIIQSLKYNKDLTYFLIGPCEITLPNHPNIIHLGSIERSYIYNMMEIADGLVMPFKVNELIRSVNPVKLYEYISADKPIFAPLYEETEVFKPYIYTYESKTDYINLCNKLGNGLVAKNSHEENNKFIKNNCWSNRIDMIVNFIEKSI